MLNIVNLGNANKNYNEISTHICKNDYYQKEKKKLTTVDEDVEERESLRTVDGNVHW